MPHAAPRALPSGVEIRAVTPPYLVATKLAAFAGRGRGDHLGSRDLEDIVALVDGREELVGEVASASDEVRAFIASQIGNLLGQPRFVDAIFGFLRPDVASQERAQLIVLPRLASLGSP